MVLNLIYDLRFPSSSYPLSLSFIYPFLLLSLSLSPVFLVGLGWRDLRFIFCTGMFKRGV